MGDARLHVVLAMETSLLTSAIQQCLADDPRLEVVVQPPDGVPTAPFAPGRADRRRTVQIALLEDPVRFVLRSDGREWIVGYRGLDGLARLLADLEAVDLMALDRP